VRKTIISNIILHADELAVMIMNKQELPVLLVHCKDVRKTHGLRMTIDRTEGKWVGRHRGVEQLGWEGE